MVSNKSTEQTLSSHAKQLLEQELTQKSEMLSNRFPNVLPPQQFIFLKMWFSALHNYSKKNPKTPQVFHALHVYTFTNVLLSFYTTFSCHFSFKNRTGVSKCSCSCLEILPHSQRGIFFFTQYSIEGTGQRLLNI